MNKKRFHEDVIINALRAVRDGERTVDQVCNEYGMSCASFYRWKTKFGGLNHGEVSRLKQLEDENRRLKKLVADQALDLQTLREAR